MFRLDLTNHAINLQLNGIIGNSIIRIELGSVNFLFDSC